MTFSTYFCGLLVLLFGAIYGPLWWFFVGRHPDQEQGDKAGTSFILLVVVVVILMLFVLIGFDPLFGGATGPCC